MNSTITIEDFEEELVDLSSSLDTSEIICLDDSQTVYKSGNTDRRFSSDHIDANNEVVNMTKTATNAEDPSSLQPDVTSQPVFKVIFRDESVSRQYRQKIRDFLYTLVQSKLSCEENVEMSNLVLEVWDNKNSQNKLPISTESNIMPLYISPNDHNTESSDVTSDLLFTIDTQPKLTNDLDVPTYGKKYESTFGGSDSETSKDQAPKMSCFNCGGNHNLRDCQLPRNQANINKNRKDFAVRYTKSGVRYHLNEEQKFSHMIPGQLSQKLRAALGLKDNELPKHVYRMRLFGYPPGWLEEVCLQPSGLSLFNSDGIAETNPNDGSREITMDINRDQYDIKKIHDFPGFNVPPPSGTIDESHKFYAPQMHPMHSKEAMLLCLQGKETDDGYKRKKLKLSTPANVSERIPCEMDIEDTEEAAIENVHFNEDFVPPLPKQLLSSLPPPPPPPPPLPSSPPLPLPPPPPSLLSQIDVMTEDSDLRSQELFSYDSADDTTLSRANSPSLSELERMKKQLLVELEETSSQSNPDASFKNNLNVTVTSEDNIQLNRSHILRKSLNTSQSSVKSVDLGTPVLQSTSPYNKLPSSEKFSKDICDVLNFENLPDSTGKYEQMTGVLQKVRNSMARIHRI